MRRSGRDLDQSLTEQRGCRRGSFVTSLIVHSAHRVPEFPLFLSHPLPGLLSLPCWHCAGSNFSQGTKPCSIHVVHGVPGNQTKPLHMDGCLIQQRACPQISGGNDKLWSMVAKGTHCCQQTSCYPYTHTHTCMHTHSHVFKICWYCLHEVLILFVSKSTSPSQGFTLHRWQFHSYSCVWFLTPHIFPPPLVLAWLVFSSIYLPPCSLPCHSQCLPSGFGQLACWPSLWITVRMQVWVSFFEGSPMG
jgi:hypothetical protein